MTATASDGALSDSKTFTWTVTNVNRPPTLTQPANQTSAENASVSLQLVASDPDGTALTYSATGLPATLAVNATTGLISGTLASASAGSYAVTATASDGALSNSKTFTWTVTNVNRPPTLTQPTSQTSAEGASVSLQLVGERPRWHRPDVQRDRIARHARGERHDRPDCGNAELHERGQLHGDRDGVGRGALRQQDVHVDGHEREPAAGAHAAGESDRRGGRDRVAPARGERPRRHGPDLQRDRVAGVAGGERDDGPDLRHASDLERRQPHGDRHRVGRGALRQQDVHLDRHEREPAPTLTQPTNQTSAENASVSLQLLASDPDGTALTYSATGLPASLAVNATTGLISGTLAAGSAGTYTVTATASDGALSDSKTLTWTVTNGDRPPTLTQPANQTSRVKTRVSMRLVASDLDGTALTYSATGLPARLTVNARTGLISGTLASTSAGAYTVTATASDGVLSDSKTFSWTVTRISVKQTSLRFNATKAGADGKLTSVTPAHGLRVLSVSELAWTATADQPWLRVVNGAGKGSGGFRVKVINPDNVLGGATFLSGAITVTPQTPEDPPVTIPVTLTIIQRERATDDPVGQIDLPVENATVQGAMAVSGWVRDAGETARVTVYRNCVNGDAPDACQPLVVLGPSGENCDVSGVSLGEAAILPGARPDLEAAFPDAPAADPAGWGLEVLTNLLPRTTGPEAPAGGEGPLTLYVVATSVEGDRALLTRGSTSDACANGSATITMANDTIAHPFGTIDTPRGGATVSGVVPVAGWALTPDDGTGIAIPTSGRTMVTFIDGAAVSPRVRYDQCRADDGPRVPAGVLCNDDIASLFGTSTPDSSFAPRTANPSVFRNLDAGRGAIGVSQLSTRTLADGLHTIAWSVTDSAGRTEAIGSRLVTVLNGGAEAPARRHAGRPRRRGHGRVGRRGSALRTTTRAPRS